MIRSALSTSQSRPLRMIPNSTSLLDAHLASARALANRVTSARVMRFSAQKVERCSLDHTAVSQLVVERLAELSVTSGHAREGASFRYCFQKFLRVLGRSRQAETMFAKGGRGERDLRLTSASISSCNRSRVQPSLEHKSDPALLPQSWRTCKHDALTRAAFVVYSDRKIRIW